MSKSAAKRLSFDTAAPMLGDNHTEADRRRYGSSSEAGAPDVPPKSGSSGDIKRRSSSLKLFERASPSWWNPTFASKLLENQYLRCAFPQIRLRFRFGLAYAATTTAAWFLFHAFISDWRLSLVYQLSSVALVALLILVLAFTFNDELYRRFYSSVGFLFAFVLIVVGLLFFCVQNPLISPIGAFAASFETVLVLYTVVPLPLYVCASSALAYSLLFEILTLRNAPYEYAFVKFALHLCAHLLGVHLFILTQVRNRKTFIKIGQSLLASKDLESEKQFKDNMIESVMPKKVAMELLKETSEFRRPSTVSAARGSIFRPFAMNLMTDVSILFADIAGFTKMSSNKSADELVNLLNDLFGRFDKLCTATGCEKISTLGDCYYCVSGCPEPRADHARCCVEMGLAMCVAIKEFDADRNQDVNMRVGIHTGTVMCGIVGTKRFKFDVFSNDVNLANSMESSGKAGLVHLSEATAKFLDDEYILEKADIYEGKLGTYFVVGRSTKCNVQENNVYANSPLAPKTATTTSPVDSTVGAAGWRMKDDIRHIDSSDIEYDVQRIEQRENAKLTSNLNKFGAKKFRSQNSLFRDSSGSLRMKLLSSGGGNDNRHKQQAQETKKSISLATLSPTAKSKDNPNSSRRITFGLSASSGVIPETVAESAVPMRSETPLAEANNDTVSSPMPDRTTASMGDLAASKVDLTKHTASITRFDTAHMDFDQRVVNCIQDSELSSDGYWSHENAALDVWTLNFSDVQLERDYRRHFADDYARSEADDVSKIDDKWRVKPPKYSVFSDLVVASAIYVIVVSVAFGVFGVVSAAFSVYFALSASVLLAYLTYASVNLIRHCKLSPPLTSWTWRHVAGLLFIDLPLGAAYANLFCLASSSDSLLPTPSNTAHQLVAIYILLVVMMAHCNFSQLVYWTKTVVAALIGVSMVVLVNCCLCICDSRTSMLLADVYTMGVQTPPKIDYTEGFTPRPAYAEASMDNIGASTAYAEASTSKPEYIAAALSTSNETLAFLTANFVVRTLNGSVGVNQTLFQLTRRYLFNPALFFGVPIYRLEIVLDVVLALLLIAFLNYQFESNFRMSFYGDKKVYRTIKEMSGMKEQADWLLFNIIPHHIQDELMKYLKYSENHEMVAVVFASIINWHEMYEENFEGGREFLRVLNELVADFDELLDRSEFMQVEKIKTIGTTYMAAAGLNANRRRLSMHPYSHLYDMMEFALELQESLESFNKDLLNFDFKMKIGYNIGPVTAGVIGSTKLYYDIWGDTVNIASRMYSTGVSGRIQVSAKARNMLQDVYDFEYRDLIEVKGIDGGMEVYLLKGRRENMQPRSRVGTGSS